MPRMTWLLTGGRPSIEIVLASKIVGLPSKRTLQADTGGGSIHSRLDLILQERDCLMYGGNRTRMVKLTGAYSGLFPIYSIRIQIPQLGFDDDVEVVGMRTISSGLDGSACFRFLTRFTYGNFGDPLQFGLEI
jgi:hypothetical protein